MYLPLIAVLTTFLFFQAGIKKIGDFSGTVKGFLGKLPFSLPYTLGALVILAVIVLEIGAPLLILRSSLDPTPMALRQARHSAFALAGFTALATLLYYTPPTGGNYFQFVVHMSILGGLLALANLF